MLVGLLGTMEAQEGSIRGESHVARAKAILESRQPHFKAVSLLREAIALGQHEAHLLLGELILQGRVTGKGPREALGHFRQARAQGVPGAQWALAKLLLNENHSKELWKEGQALLFKEVSAKNPEATYFYGKQLLLSPDMKARGWEVMDSAADLGDALAMVEVSDRYRQRLDGVKVDSAQALVLLEKAAATQNPYALTRMGQTFLMGDLGVVDLEQAHHWLERAVVLKGDGQLEKELAKEGSFLVEGLSDDWEEVLKKREEMAKAGLFPLVNLQYHRDTRVLSYAPHLVNLLVADLDALGAQAPSEDELKRTLAWEGKAYVKKSGVWKVVDNPRPTDMDEWTHPPRSAEKVPVSTDAHINSNMDGLKWAASQIKKVSGRASASLFHDGKAFSMEKTSAIRSKKDKEKWPSQYHLVVRDANNGLMLWKKQIGFMLWKKQIGFMEEFKARMFSQNYNSH